MIAFLFLPAAVAALTTTFDGVFSPQAYNQFLALEGTSGLLFESVDLTPVDEGFSLLFWFRLDELPGDEGFTFLDYGRGSLRCFLSRNMQLDCVTSGRSSIFGLYLRDRLRTDQWYLVTLVSTKDKRRWRSTYSIFEQTDMKQALASTTSSNFQAEFSNEDLVVGYDRSRKKSYLTGSVRQIQLFNASLSATQLVNSAFSKIEVDPTLLFQTTLHNLTTGLRDTVYGSSARTEVGQPQQKVDFKPQFMCFDIDPIQYPSLIKFGAGSVLDSYEMSSSIYQDSSQSGDYQVTLGAWIWWEGPTSQDQILFTQEDVQHLYIKSRTPGELTIRNFELQEEEVSVIFPARRWVWLLLWHDWNHFGIQMEDEFGAVYSKGSSRRQYYMGGTSYNTGRKISVGKDFNGFIYGMKLRKGIPNSYGPAIFAPGLDHDSDIVWYFLFSKQGFYQDTQSLKNFKYGRSSRSYAWSLNEEASFEGKLFKNSTDTYHHMSVDSAVEWDGLACGDEKKKLEFTSGVQYLESTFQLTQAQEYGDRIMMKPADGKSIDQLTIEFWFKPLTTSSQRRRTLASILKNGEAMVSVGTDSNGDLSCSPFIDEHGQQLSYSMKFPEYSGLSTWYHVSCTVEILEAGLSRVWGELYFDEGYGQIVQQAYQKEVSAELALTQSKTSDEFSARLNSQGDRTLGFDQIEFADLRVWTSPRSVENIREHRFQQLDYFEDSQDLLSAVPLLGGGNMFGEVEDFGALPSFYLQQFSQQGEQLASRAVTVSPDAGWTVDSSLVLCPLGTYYDNGICSTSPLAGRGLDVTIFKEEGQYLLSTELSDWAHGFSTNSLIFKWTLRKAGGVTSEVKQEVSDLASAQTGPALAISEEYLQDLFLFQFQVALPSSEKTEANLYILKCLELTHKGKAHAYLEVERGASDLYFDFNLTGCSPEIMSSVKVSLAQGSGAGVFLSDSTLTITQEAQNKLALEANHTFLIEANWKQQVFQNLELTLAFPAMVDLVLEAEPLIVPLSGTLAINSDKSKIVNFQGSDDEWELAWVCSEGLQASCTKAQRMRSLLVSKEEFEASAIPFWEEFTIKGVATSTFLQRGRSWTSSASVAVTWIPFDPDVELIGPTYQARDQVLELRANTHGINPEMIQFQWSVEPAVDPSHFIEGSQGSSFLIAPFALQENRNYTFWLEVSLNSNGLPFWKGKTTVLINPVPETGFVQVQPFQGTSFETIFNLTAVNFIVRDKPAQYQFMYMDQSGQFSVITPFMDEPSKLVELPPTSKIMVRVRDRKGVVMESTSTVYCKFKDEEKSLVKQDALFAKTQKETDLVAKVSSTSLLANNLNNFSGFKGFLTARLQTGEIVSMLEEWAADLTGELNAKAAPAVPTSSAKAASGLQIEALEEVSSSKNPLSSSERVYLSQSFITISSLVTQSPSLITPLKLEAVQASLGKHLEGIRREKTKIEDQLLLETLVTTQSNVLTDLYVWSSKTKLNKTDLEVIRRTAKLTRQAIIELLPMIPKSTKSLQSQNLRIELKIGGAGRRLGVADTETPLLSYSVSPKTPDPTMELSTISFSKSILYDIVDAQGGRAASNYSLFISAEPPTGLQVDVDLPFEFEHSENVERTITRCIVLDLKGQTLYCDTLIHYRDNKVSCSCSTEGGFISVARDEYSPPLPITHYEIKFRNWAVFSVLAYFVLVSSVSLVKARQIDRQQLLKLNGGRMPFGEQFPLVEFALKRQVEMMKYQESGLYIVLLAQRHPLLQFKFNSTERRQDKVLWLLVQMTTAYALSFFLFRNWDTPQFVEASSGDGQVIEDVVYDWATLRTPLVSSILLSFIFVHEGSWLLRAIRTVFFISQEEVDFDTSKDTNIFEDSSSSFDHSFNPAAINASERDYRHSIARNSSCGLASSDSRGIGILYLNPSIPIQLLLQLNAFPLDYLITKGHSRFPFLGLKCSGEEIFVAMTRLEAKFTQSPLSIFYSEDRSENQAEEIPKDQEEELKEDEAPARVRKNLLVTPSNSSCTNQSLITPDQLSEANVEEIDDVRQPPKGDFLNYDSGCPKKRRLVAPQIDLKSVEAAEHLPHNVLFTSIHNTPTLVQKKRRRSRLQVPVMSRTQSDNNLQNSQPAGAGAGARSGGDFEIRKPTDRQAPLLTAKASAKFDPSKQTSRASPPRNLFLEGGEIEMEDMKEGGERIGHDVPPTKRLVEDPDKSSYCTTAFLWLFVLGAHFVVLSFILIERIYEEDGHLLWVVIFFLAQILAWLIWCPLWIWVKATVVEKNHAKPWVPSFLMEEWVAWKDLEYASDFLR